MICVGVPRDSTTNVKDATSIESHVPSDQAVGGQDKGRPSGTTDGGGPFLDPYTPVSTPPVPLISPSSL
jgi:hypothetical protein